MPQRKSDAAQSRKSDVSATRFVLAEDGASTGAGAAQVTQPAAGAQTDLPPMSGGTASAAAEKKDKDKDKDKEKEKEKEKEREREAQKDKDALTIEDLNLPKSIITRLAKGILPPNTQIQANAILAMSKSATVFISHLANTANEYTQESNKKTIMPSDVFKALDTLEFGFMRERVEAEFEKFNEVQTSKRSTYRKKVAAAKKSAGGGTGDMSMDASGIHGDVSGAMDEDDRDRSGLAGRQVSRPPKKARTDGAGGGSSGRMEIDDAPGGGGGGNGGDDGDPSDAETVPDEPVDDAEEDDDGVEEEEEEEEEEHEDEDEERDRLEDKEDGPDPDEAVGDGDDSD